MRGNTISIVMAEKRGKMAKTIPLYQYDYGQKLIIENLELPIAYEVHFANELHGESVTSIGDSTGVDIPDSLLETGKSIYLWLFLHDGEDDGETEYAGVIPVIKRTEPTDEEPTPEQQSTITQTIAALDAGVEVAEAQGLKSEGYAVGEQDGTPVGSGTYYHNNAKYYAEQAAASAASINNVIDDTAGDGDTGKTWSADKLVDQFAEKYEKPSGGIPSTDLASAVQTSLEKADSAYQKPSGGVPSSDMASAVQTSLGKADTAYQKPSGGIPASDMASGVIPVLTDLIDDTAGDGDTNKVWSADKSADTASSLLTEINSKYTKPNTGIPATDMAEAVQTTLGKADSAYQKPQTGIPASDLESGVIPSVPVTDIKRAGVSIVNNGSADVAPVVNVTGSTPSITGVAGTRYICGEVATLSITAPASGCIDVVFESGATPTVLTVTSAKTGVTAIKWAGSFDPTSLEANTTYELNILDGEYGVVASWT